MEMKSWIFALLVALTGGVPAVAEDSLSAKLESRRIGAVEPGIYQAGDNLIFSLAHWNDKYLLRFEGDPEIYVLYPASTTMGGRILKYDTNATAISVSGWGGITIYTDTNPSGLPAVRADDRVSIYLQRDVECLVAKVGGNVHHRHAALDPPARGEVPESVKMEIVAAGLVQAAALKQRAPKFRVKVLRGDQRVGAGPE